jgi:type IV pilus assembly protein PilQ
MIADCRLRIVKFAAAAALASGAGIALAAGEPAPIRLIGVSLQGGAVVIEAAEPVGYAVSRPDPLTVIVELRDVSVAGAVNNVKGLVPRARTESKDLVAGVSIAQGTAVDGKTVGRVRVALTQPVESKVRSTRNTIRLELAPAVAKPAAVATPVHALLPRSGATTPAGAVAVEAAPATAIAAVRANPTAKWTTITLVGNGALTPTSITETSAPRRLVLDFDGVDSQAAPQTAVDSPLVKRVRVGVNSRSPLITRVVMEVADGATYHVERTGGGGRDLSVIFEASAPNVVAILPSTNGAAPNSRAPASAPRATADKPSPEPRGPSPEPDVIPLAEAIKNGTPLTPSDPVGVDPMSALKAIGLQMPAQVVRAAQQPAPQPPPPPRPLPMPPATGQQIGPDIAQKKYVGSPITLDFSGADLRTVLRLFSDASGLNILIDPAVPNTPQDFLLRDIPWDQAMEIVLRANQLGYEVDGTIIRIAPLKVLEDEQKQRASLALAQASAGPLQTRTFSLSYAKAESLSPLLVKSTLSQRGQIQVDPRTNTLIITDLAERLQTTTDLIRTLDRPEPQVEVEARIVQTTRDFARALGIQWGLNGRMMPEIGNTTNLAFPNRGTLGGRVGGQQGGAGTDVRANPTDETGTAVNLGVPAASSAIGLALGAVNGAFNLDVALSALESSGKGRVLSTPRLTTQNNVAAEIAQGVEIPIQTVSNNTVTVTFKDATLKLLVTPQITAAGTVIMQIEIQNATPDFSREVGGIPPIDTQRANTRVQVDDGATTVIGGIFVSREQASSDRTPLLHKIPILGWLFRRESTSDESRELLIFITPRIIKG